LSFDGNYINLGTSASFDLNTLPFSVSLWVNQKNFTSVSARQQRPFRESPRPVRKTARPGSWTPEKSGAS
jgi:hypothetical protein